MYAVELDVASLDILPLNLSIDADDELPPLLVRLETLMSVLLLSSTLTEALSVFVQVFGSLFKK